MKNRWVLARFAPVVVAALFATQAQPVSAKCEGGICNASCVDCSRCWHCNRDGGSCSVCARTALPPARLPLKRGAVSPKAVKPAVAQPKPSMATLSQAMFTGKCVSVHDGDTLTVLTVGNTQVKVRLYGIDSPELKQAYGSNAKHCASELAFGKQVTVHGKGVDRYGRVIGWVFVRETCVNKELVGKGLAWWYRQYAPNDKLFSDAEKYAKGAKLGLWSQPNPVAPWDWRRKN